MAVNGEKSMNENRMPDIVFKWLLYLNFIVVVYISGISVSPSCILPIRKKICEHS